MGDWENDVIPTAGKLTGDPIQDAALKLHGLMHPQIPDRIDVLCHPGTVAAVLERVPLYERARIQVRGSMAVEPHEVFIVPHWPDGKLPIGYLD